MGLKIMRLDAITLGKGWFVSIKYVLSIYYVSGIKAALKI